MKVLQLSPLSSNPSGQLDILRHNGYPLSMNSTQVCILKQTNKIRLCRLLKGCHCTALEPQIGLEILGYFPHQPLKWKLPYQQLSALLVLPDLSQRHCSWPETVGLLHSSGGWSWLPGSFKIWRPPLLLGKICGPRILKKSTVVNVWRNVSGIAIRVLC